MVAQRSQCVPELAFLSATELLQHFRDGTATPLQAVNAYADRIQRLNKHLHAYVLLRLDEAREAAREAERRYRQGTARPLEGLPIATKDLFDWEEGVRNTFGSAIFAEDIEFVPDHSSHHIARLLDAGAISLGKTASPEFGHKGITASPAHGDTSTPFAPPATLRRSEHSEEAPHGLNSGGSSGGSASAVAAFMCAASEGSDAGGSIRIPAAATATVGLKLSYGQIPTDVPPVSVNPFLYTGPITRTVTDAALLGDLMAHPWIGDPTSTPKQTQLTRSLSKGINGARIAFSPDLGVYPTDPRMVRVIRENLSAFEEAGAHVEEAEVNLAEVMVGLTPEDHRPLTHDDLSTMWRELMGVLYAGSVVDYFSEFGIDMMRLQEKMTPEFLSLLKLADEVTGRRVRNLETIQMKIKDVFHRLWTERGYDFLITPTLACLPQALPNKGDGTTVGPTEVNGTPVEPTIGWCMTTPLNYSGEPAANVPAGFVDGLPVGMQIIGPRWSDENVIAAAHAFEQRRPWHHRYPH